MRPVVIATAILLLLHLVSFGVASDRIEVTASVDKQSAYIGDLIEYNISIKYDSTLNLTPPMVGANLGQFDVKDYKVPDKVVLEDGLHEQQLKFIMRTFTTGEYIIPQLPIEYMLPDSTMKIIATEPIKIEIKSLLGDADSVDTLKLRPLKKQVSLARSHTSLILTIAAAAVIVAGLAVYIIIRRRRTKADQEYVDPRPAWEIAFADLAMLKDKNLPGKGEIKKFYFELSDIFRRFIGKKFDFNAIDLTTEEINGYFEETTLPEAIRLEILEFLEHADLIKFAKYIPPEEQPMVDWEKAYGLVEKTREVFIGPASEPEPALVLQKNESTAENDDPQLRYVPADLHDYVKEQKKEEEAS
jgi:hypothetical protein